MPERGILERGTANGGTGNEERRTGEVGDWNGFKNSAFRVPRSEFELGAVRM
jgi:hypothetical protein